MITHSNILSFAVVKRICLFIAIVCSIAALYIMDSTAGSEYVAESPRSFHDVASTVPIGWTAKQLREFLSEPDYVLTLENLKISFSLEPIPKHIKEYIDGYSLLNNKFTFKSYQEFALYSMWENLIPRLQRGKYSTSWISKIAEPETDVWIYAEPKRFGKNSFKLHGWLFFMKNSAVKYRTKINPWLDEYFKAQP